MRKLHFVTLFVLLAAVALAMPPASSAQIAVGVSVRLGPPPLRVVAVQPICPGPDYIWTPGYWAYGPDGYYWVEGTWVRPPQVGLLWTPGYWAFDTGVYRWHAGYWGPHVGFYGGINYGFGYFGTGFAGGHWDRGHFFYNTAVWHVNEHVVRNVYVDRTVIRDVHVNRVSYNGRGGMEARPNREEVRYDHERHYDRTPMQVRHDEGFRGGNRGGNGYHSFQPPNHADNHGRGNAYGRESRESMDRPHDSGRGNAYGREVRPNQSVEHGNNGNRGEHVNNGNHGEHVNNGHGHEGGPKGEGKPNGGPRREGKPEHQRR
jgi:WXXGXW repeat (2 copies)